MISRNNCSRLGVSSGARKVTPVIFPPGRANVATSPSAMGSAIMATTMGIVVVQTRKLISQQMQSPVVQICVTVFDLDVLPVDIPVLAQPVSKVLNAAN